MSRGGLPRSSEEAVTAHVPIPRGRALQRTGRKAGERTLPILGTAVATLVGMKRPGTWAANFSRPKHQRSLHRAVPE